MAEQKERQIRTLSKSANDLFDNKFVNSIKKGMSKQELEKYVEVGEKFYADIDMIDPTLALDEPEVSPTGPEGPKISSGPPPKPEVNKEHELFLKYILEGIKSGLNPDELMPDEKKFVHSYFGRKEDEEWEWRELLLQMSRSDAA